MGQLARSEFADERVKCEELIESGQLVDRQLRLSDVNAHGSLFQAVNRRQVCPCKVHVRPYLGDLTSDGGVSGSGVLTTETNGICFPPLAISFAKRRGNGHMLAVADEEGFVSIFDTNCRLPSTLDSSRKTGGVRREHWLAHSNAIFDACWMKDDSHMLTASGDQTIRFWDIEAHKGVGIMKGHNGSVKTLCVHPSQPDLFISGSRDGCVAFWDTRTCPIQSSTNECSFEPVTKIKDAHSGGTTKSRRKKGVTRSVTSVLYLKDDRFIATAGANDGVVKFWDTRKLKMPVSQTPPKHAAALGSNGSRMHGIAGLSQDPYGTRIIATSVDSKIYMYDVVRPEKGEIKSFSGHIMGSFYIKAAFSPDGYQIMSGSTDGNVFVWEVDGPNMAPVILRGHDGEVTAVDWCPTDMCKVATCSDDFTVRVWNLKEPRFAPKSSLANPAKRRGPREPRSPLTPLNINLHPMKFGCDEEVANYDNGARKNLMGNMSTAYGTENVPSLNSGETPSPKRVHNSLASVSMNCAQQSPQSLLSVSPCSVLNPPGSSSRKPRTIVDYFGSNLHWSPPPLQARK